MAPEPASGRRMPTLRSPKAVSVPHSMEKEEGAAVVFLTFSVRVVRGGREEEARNGQGRGGEVPPRPNAVPLPMT